MRRLECLDGLRGALAVYVLVSHMAPFAAAPGWMLRPFAHGGAAVDVFFVLSGMVILRSLDRFGWRAGPFLHARVRRIFPVFLVVFAVAVAVQPLPTGLARMPWIGPAAPARAIWSSGWPRHWAAEILAHLTMTHGLFPHGLLGNAWVSFLGAAWSLSTEWQFYVLLAALAVARGERVRRGLTGLFLLLTIGALIWGAVAPPGLRFSRAFLPNKAAYFALGIAAADVAAGGAARRYIGVLAAVLGLCLVQGGAGKLAAPLVWTACLAAELAPGQPLLRHLARLLRARPMQWLGAVSYCLYLVNEPIQKLLGLALAVAARGDGALFTALWVPSALLLPLLAAWGLHAAVERPFLRRRARPPRLAAGLVVEAPATR